MQKEDDGNSGYFFKKIRHGLRTMLEKEHYVSQEDLRGSTTIPAPDVEMAGLRIMYRYDDFVFDNFVPITI